MGELNSEAAEADSWEHWKYVITTTSIASVAWVILSPVAFRLITERNLTEDALRQSEENYRAVVENQTELICRSTSGGVITFVNEAYCH